MNLAQQLVEKGIQQGVQQGIQTTIINVAKGMLALNLDLNSIHLVTKLSKETLQKLKNEMING